MKRRGFFGSVLAGLASLGWAATRFKHLKVGDIFRHGFPDEIDKKTGQSLESIEFEVVRPATYLEKEGTWELFVYDVCEKAAYR